MEQNIEIPKQLLNSILEGDAILFLGAGASIGALHPEGKPVPIGNGLADILVERFLDDKFKGRSLDVVSDLAINEAGLLVVQQFIYDYFIKYDPADFHKLIPTFSWKSIFTTNYDLIVERAYASVPNKAQNLVPFKQNGEAIEKKMKVSPSVMYSKLHGCITEINNPGLPLILTPDQYITHRKNRSRLFDRLKIEAFELPVVFIGYSLADHDIRSILVEIDHELPERPRSFAIGPSISDEESRLWDKKKVTAIKATFKDFLFAINKNITASARKLGGIKTEYEHAIVRKFRTTDTRLSPGLKSFLDIDVDFVHKNIQAGTTDAKAFYKGYFEDWDAIINEFDVKRKLSDDIIQEVFLTTESNKLMKQELFVLKGHAGSGKSVILKRIAWDASVVFDKLCLFDKSTVEIDFADLAAVYNLCKERIYLFIDNLYDNYSQVIKLLTASKDENLPLTIITSIRYHEWNDISSSISPYTSFAYILTYLNDKEIADLLVLLKKNDPNLPLGKLPYEKQVEALSKKAGRELLVALHEATLGEPFEIIIKNEFDSIASEKAKSLYLTVSIFHRLGVHARAGLISRTHGISFEKFEKEFFEPLEYIVFSKINKRTGDYEYQTRHQHIANMLFESVLNDEQGRFDEYFRILNHIDIDYQSDNAAFFSMMNAKNLSRLFTNSNFIRKLFEVGEKRAAENGSFFQQRAIYEMNSPDGSFEEAEKYLSLAHKKSPWNRAITHSFSEFWLRKAAKAENKLERDKYYRQAQDVAIEMNSSGEKMPHATHTLIKVNIFKLSEAIQLEDKIAIEDLSKKTEVLISNAKQSFPEEAVILEAEADFNTLLKNNTRAIQILKEAFNFNEHNPHLAIRLASIYEDMGNDIDAKVVYERALDNMPMEKDLNFRYAMLIGRVSPNDLSSLKLYFKKSFVLRDSRFAAQFWYARCIYLLNEIPAALEVFASLNNAKISPSLKQQPRGIVEENGSQVEYLGAIDVVDTSFAFIRRDGIADKIYAYRYSGHQVDWETLKHGDRIRFNLGFTYKGPIALNLRLE